MMDNQIQIKIKHLRKLFLTKKRKRIVKITKTISMRFKLEGMTMKVNSTDAVSKFDIVR